MNTIYKFANWLYGLFLLPDTILANIYLHIWLYNNFIGRIPNYKDISFKERLILFYTMVGKEEYRDEIIEHAEVFRHNVGRAKYIFCLFIWAVIILAII